MLLFTKTRPPKTPDASLRRQVTDALHSILRQHMQITHERPHSGSFNTTEAQRNADLVQALQRSQRNL